MRMSRGIRLFAVQFSPPCMILQFLPLALVLLNRVRGPSHLPYKYFACPLDGMWLHSTKDVELLDRRVRHVVGAKIVGCSVGNVG